MAPIADAVVEPGADLDEASISAEYGLSRTPLREVLQRLAGEGYVRIEDNRGAKVASMDVSVMRTFFQTAPLVYSSVARLAAENRRSDQLAPLKQIQTRFAAAARNSDPAEAALHNHAFHAHIGEMAEGWLAYAFDLCGALHPTAFEQALELGKSRPDKQMDYTIRWEVV